MADKAVKKIEFKPYFLADEELRNTIESLFYAYRDFTGIADAILKEFGFGRAHHRVIYFVGAYPSITVTELLDILKITKQSLSRVLSVLILEDFIIQRKQNADRRRRHLFLSKKGVELAGHASKARAPPDIVPRHHCNHADGQAQWHDRFREQLPIQNSRHHENRHRSERQHLPRIRPIQQDPDNMQKHPPN